MSEEPDTDEEPIAGVAERMADAIAYLSAVAEKAGLGSISADLLLIRKKLKRRVVPSNMTSRRKSARSG
jgi:hypothetical protein